MVRIRLILQGIDNASSVMDRVNSSTEALKKTFMKKSVEATALMGTGYAIASSIAPAIKAYSTLEESQTDLKASMMDASGAIDKNFERIAGLAETLGNKLPGTTADFNDMFKTMMNNGIKTENILAGLGKAAAYVAVDLKMGYAEAGEFAARMQQATGVADKDMLKYMDTISKANGMGLKIEEMRYAFMRSTGTLKSLGLQGLDSANKMSVLFGLFARNGAGGEIGGTAFNSIISSLQDSKKFEKANAAAKAMGINLQFFKGNKFLGIENMMAQFEKLKGAKNKDAILSTLFGSGQDAQVAKTMVNEGLAGYMKLSKEMNNKATLTDKVNVKLLTLKALWESTTGTIENMLAALGKGLQPILAPLITMIGDIAGKIQEFLKANPGMAKFLMLATSLVGIFVTLMGAVKMIQAIRTAFILLNITMQANPFILIATVAILAISLIYANWDKIKVWFTNLWDKIKKIFFAVWDWIKNMFLNYTPYGLVIKHWDKIKAFFLGLWDRIKAMFKATWEWIKNMFLNYTPHGLIIKHWDKISQFFSNLWEKVKAIFSGMFKWVLNFGKQFYQAGANIITSIINGITSKITALTDKVKGVAKKIRDFFPFSPAKEGALKDIHKVKLMETIAASINAKPMMNALNNALQTSFNGRQPQLAGIGGGNKGGMVFSPTITLYGGATQQDANMISNSMKVQLDKWYKDMMGNKQRTNF